MLRLDEDKFYWFNYSCGTAVRSSVPAFERISTQWKVSGASCTPKEYAGIKVVFRAKLIQISVADAQLQFLHYCATVYR